MSDLKLLVFAHTPPPHHGQSLMVEVMVNGFGGDSRGSSASRSHGIAVYHVNARLSANTDNVGVAEGGKWFKLLRYCMQTIGARLRHGVDTLYYIPAPARRTPLLRDWTVMTLCRPFFRRLILHWHAVGLGAWLETEAWPWERWLTRRLLGKADLALVLSEASRADAEKLQPRRVRVVANGIADPCPDYETTVRPQREARRARRQDRLGRGSPPPQAGTYERSRPEREVARVFFMAHCTRDKGLFDAVEAVALANAALEREGAAVRLDLTVAGTFLTVAEREEFERLQAANSSWLHHVGFADADAKARLFREADVFLFPTYYANEGQPVALIEAMAFGLPVVTTKWRAIPEALPADYPGLVEPRQPAQAPVALRRALTEDGARLREQFTTRFEVEAHLDRLAQAIREVIPASP